MNKVYLPSVSYTLWSLFQPAVGKEELYCDMKRGFTKVRNKEPKIKALDADNKHQRIGKLAQMGVYEFHHNIELLYKQNGLELVVKILKLDQELEEVQSRVITILKNYQSNPILASKNIIKLSKGDEKSLEEVTIKNRGFSFKLYAPTDCLLEESDGSIHILDFKTGKSDFDRRQAYVYLLAASYLYPQKQAIASFYNLETCVASDLITASYEQLKFVEIELEEIAKQHEIQKKNYWNNPDNFSRIFPPNPGVACKLCSFKSVCEFYKCEVNP